MLRDDWRDCKKCTTVCPLDRFIDRYYHMAAYLLYGMAIWHLNSTLLVMGDASY